MLLVQIISVLHIMINIYDMLYIVHLLYCLLLMCAYCVYSHLLINWIKPENHSIARTKKRLFFRYRLQLIRRILVRFSVLW